MNSISFPLIRDGTSARIRYLSAMAIAINSVLESLPVDLSKVFTLCLVCIMSSRRTVCIPKGNITSCTPQPLTHSGASY